MLVVVDPVELPRAYHSIDVLAEQIGDAVYRANGITGSTPGEADRPTAEPASGHALPDSWGREMKAAADFLRARVTLGDPHLDAKLFPSLLPHGTGSCRAEDGAGGLQKYCRSLLCSLDHSFRRSPVWMFFQLDRMIKNDLYFRERGRKRAAQALEAGDPASVDAAGHSGVRDPHAELFGRVDPRHIPESASWFHGQQKDLMALSADHELGLPTAMVTLTQNDSSPELLAHARRGPCAVPTEELRCVHISSHVCF